MLHWRHATISPQDLNLFRVTDDLREALAVIEESRHCRANSQALPPAATLHSPTAEGTFVGQPARVRKKRH
jgi:hypothetical protein